MLSCAVTSVVSNVVVRQACKTTNVANKAGCCCEPVDELNKFTNRALGPDDKDTKKMLATISAAHGKTYSTLDDLTNSAIPDSLKFKESLEVGSERTEQSCLDELKSVASKNKLLRSFIGMGYTTAITPQVIKRNVLENAGWYTPYTPYQAEVSQGRLEAMLAFQQIIVDLTGLSIANCSLLDEATAAAEAAQMCVARKRSGNNDLETRKPVTVVVSDGVHPQVIEVIKTRLDPLGAKVTVVSTAAQCQAELSKEGFAGVIVGYPNTLGKIEDFSALSKQVKAAGGLFVVDADLLSLAVLKEPGKFGADVCVGTSGRFGLPMGYGGAHAAFLSTTEELKRAMPGRIIGVSRDAAGEQAYRLALQTREQHIKREKASSNICTASGLMAQVAAFYGMWHGPEGIKAIAEAIHSKTEILHGGLKRLGFQTGEGPVFDTVVVQMSSAHAARALHERAKAKGMNFRQMDGNRVGITLDEATTHNDVGSILRVFANKEKLPFKCSELAVAAIPEELARKTAFMTHPLFNSHHSETAMMRYLYTLQTKDIGLNQRMVALGSCTMKLNPAAAMAPILWPEFTNVHPFAPADQVQGYTEMLSGLSDSLCNITGFDACSLQPMSGASGEYAGLLTIRQALIHKGQGHRNVCLIPVSAHGTNPASSSMAGFKTVVVACDSEGNIDLADLKEKAEHHKDHLACLMMTYPSTHGVFEDTFIQAAKCIHDNGGYVYMDGANMNAQVGLIKPRLLGADVCHLNLHKTFAMPHGGGGPGMGPICGTNEMAPHMPGHAVVKNGVCLGKAGAVSGSPYGAASLLPISWMYIKMLGNKGLKKSTQTAILNANYMASRLKGHYDVLFTDGSTRAVGHEFILDVRPFEKLGIDCTDLAKRLIDYGFHAPTLAFPVHGTLMIEPTESEPLEELDRFCDSMIAIRKEIAAIERGDLDKLDNPLKNSPHTAREVTATSWNHKYPRELAAYPIPATLKDKYWAPVKRVDNTFGDLHLQPTLPTKFDE